jgi:hypothetical protein
MKMKDWGDGLRIWIREDPRESAPRIASANSAVLRVDDWLDYDYEYEYDYEHDYDDEHEHEHEQERRLSIFE